MQTELDALRLLLAKEHSFSPDRRYIRPSHNSMVPLLIRIGNYARSRCSTLDSQRDLRLQICSFICEAHFSTSYEMTYWQIVTISKFLEDLDNEQPGKAEQFLEYIEAKSQE